MPKLKVHKAFDEFLLDPNLSLKAKGFLTMVLTNNITHGIEIKEHCTDSMDDSIFFSIRISFICKSP